MSCQSSGLLRNTNIDEAGLETHMQTHFTRRTVIGTLLSTAGLTSVAGLSACGGSNQLDTLPTLVTPPTPTGQSLLNKIGSLLAPDTNGVMLPEGFTSRIVAISGEPASENSSYLWHGAPDGGAVFETEDGGWIYTSNSELRDGEGGAGALVFDADGNVIDSYSILSGTTRNCAGGAMPWGTWLSCEETADGLVWECDPMGQKPAIARPQLGAFQHEAAAINPNTNIIYMTEDKQTGLFYRFIPENIGSTGIPDLSSGTLQAAVVDETDNSVTWLDVPDPLATRQYTRRQVPDATTFRGGEGIVYYDNVVSFTTKGDNRIWAYQTDVEIMSVIYDRDTAPDPILSGVDNVALSKKGELVISEDQGDMQIVAIVDDGRLVPLMQLAGHDRSEVTGPAFSPDGKRLYFSSQRGTEGGSGPGMTFEVTGPFHT